MKLRVKSLFLLAMLSMLLPLLFTLIVGASRCELPQQHDPVTLLKSPKEVLDRAASSKHIRSVATSRNGKSIYTLDDSGSVVIHNRASKFAKTLHIPDANVKAFAVGQQGNVYLINAKSQMLVINPDGALLGTFPVPVSASLAVLSNGNIVVATTEDGYLLHLYDSAGTLLKRFGAQKRFVGEHRQDQFLNEGIAVVGWGDAIYYVSKYAPTPTIQKFDGQGDFVSEASIEGAAVQFQVDNTNAFISERTVGKVGGFTVVSSAVIDPTTGHLWIGMNGLSTTGVVYEYSIAGEKIREYAFLSNASGNTKVITDVKGIAVNNSSIDVLNTASVQRFDFSNSEVLSAAGLRRLNHHRNVAQNTAPATNSGLLDSFTSMFWSSPKGASAVIQTTCGTPQSYACTSNCPTGTDPNPADCGAAIMARLAANDVVTTSSCNRQTVNETPGASNPGGCSATAKLL